ncbi:hypothetical protein TTHERM_00053760 (macronuclear) [Tetrahymena thermophila SB210]|uniref:Uncharacterized protein n=1 Tax=Tetrahymena thermophila (strain SB210) TaxID=312017 RepID=I7LTT6_TETTS|nr:hypothetical protein TTHERM_00053760 [Tetrahymena thermophila SB210]EAR87260.1 hypothetical protein TTHERM_00053760 [Tetrahymena thermophila SB210]|eukprot:XP_001007505.1 hypothetical protein TTHERM_00053760 [Tetrahymena thermophila SB210]
MSNNINEIILYNILYLERSQKSSKSSSSKNYLNKWFQDNAKTYIMRKLAAPLLLKALNLKKTEDVQNLVKQNKIKNVPEYIGVIVKYFDLIISHNLEQQFSKNLFSCIFSFPQLISQDQLDDYSVLKKIRNSFVCVLVQTFFNYYLEDKMNIYNCQNFFQIWNITFPQNQIMQRRRNQYQMGKSHQKQIKQEEQMIYTGFNSSENTHQIKNFQNEESFNPKEEMSENILSNNEFQQTHQIQQQNISLQQNQQNTNQYEFPLIDNNLLEVNQQNNEYLNQEIEMMEHNYCFLDNQFFPYEQDQYQQEQYKQISNYHYQNQYCNKQQQQQQQYQQQQYQQNDIFSLYEPQDFFNFIDNN